MHILILFLDNLHPFAKSYETHIQSVLPVLNPFLRITVHSFKNSAHVRNHLARYYVSRSHKSTELYRRLGFVNKFPWRILAIRHVHSCHPRILLFTFYEEKSSISELPSDPFPRRRRAILMVIRRGKGRGKNAAKSVGKSPSAEEMSSYAVCQNDLYANASIRHPQNALEPDSSRGKTNCGQSNSRNWYKCTVYFVIRACLLERGNFEILPCEGCCWSVAHFSLLRYLLCAKNVSWETLNKYWLN